MRIIRVRMFVCPYAPISPNSPGILHHTTVYIVYHTYNSRSGAFGRVLSYDGQTLSRSEDVGHRFDPFFIQTPSLQMPRAFGEVG